VTAKTLALRLEIGRSPADALAHALTDVAAMGGRGGLILVRRDGTVAFAFDTPQMAAAWRTGDRHGSEEGVDVWEQAGVWVPVPGAAPTPAER
jgi:isoaspartyl peptidase/L-asparaginase-like protein (Ntn-hydrolase superfamily)